MEVLSYGGGRNTAGMLAMVALGHLPKPDAIVMADTGGELPETYAHVEEWAKPLAQSLGVSFEVVRYTVRGQVVSLYDYAWKYRWLPQPWQRMCTRKFKVAAINRYLAQWKKAPPVIQWLGITIEESQRVRVNPTKWIQNRYPLIEQGYTVHDCINALEELGAPEPIKSACFYCPFQSRERWALLQARHPDLFQKAIDLEEHAREKNAAVTLNGRAPLKTYLEGEQGSWDELLDAEAGCNSGVCFV